MHRTSREPVQKGQFPNGFTGQQQVFLTKKLAPVRNRRRPWR